MVIILFLKIITCMVELEVIHNHCYIIPCKYHMGKLLSNPRIYIDPKYSKLGDFSNINDATLIKIVAVTPHITYFLPFHS